MSMTRLAPQDRQRLPTFSEIRRDTSPVNARRDPMYKVHLDEGHGSCHVLLESEEVYVSPLPGNAAGKKDN